MKAKLHFKRSSNIEGNLTTPLLRFQFSILILALNETDLKKKNTQLKLELYSFLKNIRVIRSKSNK